MMSWRKAAEDLLPEARIYTKPDAAYRRFVRLVGLLSLVVWVGVIATMIATHIIGG